MKKAIGLVCKFVGLGTLFGGFAAARADSIEYVGPDSPSQSVTVSYNGNSQNFSVGTDAGFLQFDVISGNSGVSNPFEAICGDVFDDIYNGSVYGDTVLTSPFTGGAVMPYTTPRFSACRRKHRWQQF